MAEFTARPGVVPVVFGLALLVGCSGEAVHTSERDEGCWREMADYGPAARDTLRSTFTIRSTADHEAVLHDVRGARRFPDGRMVVANAGTSQLFVYDGQGRRIQVVGRRGSGPGEFQAIQRLVGVAGDTVAAYDARLKRVSLFAGTPLSLVGDFRVEGPFATFPAGFLASGPLVIYSHAYPDGPEATLGPNTVHHRLARVPRDGSAPAVLDTLPGRRLWIGEAEEAPGSRVLFGEAPFSPQSHYGIRGDSILVFPGDPYEFHLLASDGRRVCGYRAPHVARPVTEGDQRAHLHNWVRAYGDEDDWDIRERWFAAVDYPDRMPAYRSAHVGTDGTVWIEPYAEWDGERRTFVGYDEGGAVVGVVVLPGSAEPLEFGAGWVVTLEREASGVEVVRVRAR